MLAVTGENASLVALENVSKVSCTLKGYPTLRMLDAGGNFIAARVTHTITSGAKLFPVPPLWGWSP